MIDFKVLPEALLFIAGAVPNTLFMAFVSIFFGILFGSFIAVLRLGNNMFINIFFTVFVSFFRAVPGIVQLFIVYYSLPYLLAPVFSAFTGTEVKPFDVSPYWSVYLCFILYNTAYQSENIRGALRSVDHGQYEAAIDPELTIDRALETYLKKGYTREWINQRLQAIQVRKELTDSWQDHGVTEGKEYAILTNEISKAWSGMTTRQYKDLKGLKKENLRDNMSTTELILNMLAETATKDIAESANPQGLEENKKVAKRGGEIAGNARREIEAETGKPVITSKNAIDFGQLIDGVTKTIDKGDTNNGK